MCVSVDLVYQVMSQLESSLNHLHESVCRARRVITVSHMASRNRAECRVLPGPVGASERGFNECG